MEIDQRKVIDALGGSGAVQGMDSEAKAEALEAYLSNQLDIVEGCAVIQELSFRLEPIS